MALGASLVLLGCESLQDAVADGDTRTISLHHVHTGEDLKITYKRNGRYDEEALKKINWVMRDWRRNEDVRMDPHLIDLVWEVHRDLNAKEAIQIICGYRAPETNAMLRRRSGGVARISHHMTGKAIDFGIPGVPLEDLRAAGLRLQRGGVGFYPSSGSPFVHLDVGGVRHWPRMTRDQLVRVFPNGRTVHIPTDGNPLPGYELALADIDKRGSTSSALSLAAIDRDGSAAPKRNLFGKLFGLRDKDEEDDDAPATARARPSAPAIVRTPAIEPQPAKAEPAPAREATPLPKARPVTTQVAALPAPEPVAKPARLATVATVALPTSANDIIEARGYWQGLPEPETRKPPVEISAARARPIQTASADPTASIGAFPTGSIGPFPAPDRVPADVALAYAAEAGLPTRRPEPMGSAMPRPAAIGASGTSDRAQKQRRPPIRDPVDARRALDRAGDGGRPLRRALDARGDHDAEPAGLHEHHLARHAQFPRAAPAFPQARHRLGHDLLGRSASRHDRREVQRQRGGFPCDRDIRDPHRGAAVIPTRHCPIFSSWPGLSRPSRLGRHGGATLSGSPVKSGDNTNNHQARP